MEYFYFVGGLNHSQFARSCIHKFRQGLCVLQKISQLYIHEIFTKYSWIRVLGVRYRIHENIHIHEYGFGLRRIHHIHEYTAFTAYSWIRVWAVFTKIFIFMNTVRVLAWRIHEYIVFAKKPRRSFAVVDEIANENVSLCLSDQLIDEVANKNVSLSLWRSRNTQKRFYWLPHRPIGGSSSFFRYTFAVFKV